MGDGLKGLAFGFGATFGVIAGLYAAFKGIELIGYAQAKREMSREKDLKEQVAQARAENHTALPEQA